MLLDKIEITIECWIYDKEDAEIEFDTSPTICDVHILFIMNMSELHNAILPFLTRFWLFWKDASK